MTKNKICLMFVLEIKQSMGTNIYFTTRSSERFKIFPNDLHNGYELMPDLVIIFISILSLHFFLCVILPKAIYFSFDLNEVEMHSWFCL